MDASWAAALSVAVLYRVVNPTVKIAVAAQANGLWMSR
jgi:hypothetical protein